MEKLKSLFKDRYSTAFWLGFDTCLILWNISMMCLFVEHSRQDLAIIPLCIILLLITAMGLNYWGSKE